MSAPHTNGHAAGDSLSNTPAPAESLGSLDAITEAEALRTVLHEAASRVSRLLAALKFSASSSGRCAWRWSRCAS